MESKKHLWTCRPNELCRKCLWLCVFLSHSAYIIVLAAFTNTPPLVLKQHTLSSGELIGCSSFVYLFNLEIKLILLFIIYISYYLLFLVLQGFEKLDKQLLSYKKKGLLLLNPRRVFPWCYFSLLSLVILQFYCSYHSKGSQGKILLMINQYATNPVKSPSY